MPGIQPKASRGGPEPFLDDDFDAVCSVSLRSRGPSSLSLSSSLCTLGLFPCEAAIAAKLDVADA